METDAGTESHLLARDYEFASDYPTPTTIERAYDAAAFDGRWKPGDFERID